MRRHSQSHYVLFVKKKKKSLYEIAYLISGKKTRVTLQKPIIYFVIHSLNYVGVKEDVNRPLTCRIIMGRNTI